MSKRQFKLAISPIIWSNDDMRDLGAETSFEQCLDEMALAGYHGCEIGHKFPSDIQVLKDHLRSRGLQACNKWFDFRLTTESLDSNLERLEVHLSALRSLDCNIVGGGEVGNAVYPHPAYPLSRRPKLYSHEEWSKYGQRLNACGMLARDFGLKLAFHPHMGTIVQDEEDIGRLLEATDPSCVFINFDTGHCAFAGDDPLTVLGHCKNRLAHLHLKNIRPDIQTMSLSEDWSFLRSIREGVFTIPGDVAGQIAFEPILSFIVQMNYPGWLVVEAEQNPDLAPPFINAKKAHTYLLQLLLKLEKEGSQ